MQVELVHTTTSDQVPLDGYLRLPSSQAPRGPLDLVICHHGVGAKFYNPSFFDVVGDALLDRGCAVLRVNNRGHDDVFLVGERPFGAAYEIVDDCRHDITAWLDFAQARGFARVALWGHSLGAVKTIYFLSVQDDARIVCAAASSPPRFSYAMYASAHDGQRFQSAIQRAQDLVNSDSGLDLVEAEVPVRRRFTARTYLDKYGPDARYDYLSHLPNVRKPLLLTVGSLEANNVSFEGLVHDGHTFNGRWPNVNFGLIDGADHAYTNRTDELWTALASWLDGVRSQQPVHP
ncbi:MAG: alpha/beta fold hydrolase [Chloroflexi bacterium]|nr:alpha/beta fold hydrolase [Chloroflexota bacterium]